MKLIIATKNANKVVELQAMLEPLGFEVCSLLDFEDAIDVEETGATFEENAILKATAICKHYNTTVIADDSGLEIEALDGLPGVASARFMGEQTPYAVKNHRIIELMKEKSNRRAAFVCAIAFQAPNEPGRVFTFRLEGIIAQQPMGTHGFGYDPIFYLPTHQATFAQLPLAIKNKISHRAKALALLIDYLKKRP